MIIYPLSDGRGITVAARIGFALVVAGVLRLFRERRGLGG
jgi:hypothetical protein